MARHSDFKRLLLIVFSPLPSPTLIVAGPARKPERFGFIPAYRCASILGSSDADDTI